MSKRGPSSRKGDPNWKPKPAQKTLSIQKKVATARDAHKIPTNKDEQDYLGEELIEWTHKNDEAFSLDGFPLSYGFSPYKFYQIAKKNVYFAECLEFARYVMLSGMRKVILKNPTKFTMHTYQEHKRWWDKDYAEHYKEMIELRKSKPDDDDNKNVRIVYQEVVIPDFGSSGMVPEKPKEEHES